MKRVGYKFEKVYDIENLKLAHKNARKGNTKKDDVLKTENNAILYFKRKGQCVFNNMCNFTDWNNVRDVDLSEWKIYNKK